MFNETETALSEAADGLLFACGGAYEKLAADFGCCVIRRSLPADRVRIIVDGGGGYGPMWLEFAAPGLADAIVCGDFNSAPNAYTLFDAGRRIDCGRGVLLLANNYMGDYLNNDMAADLLRESGVEAEACYVSDDLFSSAGEPRENRGGLCGIGLVCKTAAAAAAAGLPLAEVRRLADKCAERVRSLSALLREDGTLAFGCGFSGEPPAGVVPWRSCRDLAERAAEFLLAELADYPDDPVCLLVDRAKQTCVTEGFVLLNAFRLELEKRGRTVFAAAQGDYFDVFPGQGCVVSVLAADEELRRYLRPVTGYEFTL